MKVLTEASHVYCKDCNGIQPVLIQLWESSRDDEEEQHALDVVCSECEQVIATLYGDEMPCRSH